MTHVIVRSVTDKFARTDLTESHTRTVVRVDISRNLKDETGELGFFGHHDTFFGLHRTGTRSYLHKRVEQLFHTKVVQSRTKEYRSQFALQIVVYLKLGINAVYQLQFAAQLVGKVLSDPVVQFFGMDVNFHLFGYDLLAGLEEVELLFVNVVNALEAGTTLNGPRQRTHVNMEFFLQFVKKVERIFGFAVHLVDEDDDRRVPHTAHFHQLACLRFHTFGTVHHDDNAVYRCQRAVSVFGKVLVTRCIKDVDL